MSESNYQPPLADLTPTLGDNSDEQDWADFIGPNGTEYYLERFRRMRDGKLLSWHWPSFFLTLGWLFYRKFWLIGLAYLVFTPLLFAFLLGVLAAAFDADGIMAAYVIYFGFIFLVIPVFANRLYYAKARRKITRVSRHAYAESERRDALVRSGGTNLVMAIVIMLVPVFFVGLLAAVSIPAYNDFTVRAQVSEGISLASGAKAAVTKFYQDTGSWPADNRAAGIEEPSRVSGLYVESVAVDSGVIVINYGGEAAHESIAGGKLIMNPNADLLPVVEWVCYSPDIAPRYLPAICRHQE